MILVFMHSLDVLLEIVHTWPYLAFVGTRRSCAEVGLRIGDANLVHALLVTIKIVGG